jgi:hypothetical protein
MRLISLQLDLFRNNKLTHLKDYEPKSELLQRKSKFNTARHISGSLNCYLYIAQSCKGLRLQLLSVSAG